MRMVFPINRFEPISNIRLVAAVAPAFEATAAVGTLHLDIETGPARIYGTEIFEVHFGVQAQYQLAALNNPVGPSFAQFEMSRPMYATILRRVARSI